MYVPFDHCLVCPTDVRLLITLYLSIFKRFFGDMMKTTCCSYNRCHLNHLLINKLVTPKNLQSPVSNKYFVVYHILPVSLDCPFGIL